MYKTLEKTLDSNNQKKKQNNKYRKKNDKARFLFLSISFWVLTAISTNNKNHKDLKGNVCSRNKLLNE